MKKASQNSISRKIPQKTDFKPKIAPKMAPNISIPPVRVAYVGHPSPQMLSKRPQNLCFLRCLMFVGDNGSLLASCWLFSCKKMSKNYNTCNNRNDLPQVTTTWWEAAVIAWWASSIIKAYV